MRTESPLQRRIREYGKDPDFILERLLWDINEALVRAMKQHGISRSELAARLGKSRPYVTKLLRGEANLTLRSLVKLAAALGLEVNVALVPAGPTSNRHAPVSRHPGSPSMPRVRSAVVS